VIALDVVRQSDEDARIHRGIEAPLKGMFACAREFA